MSKRVLLGEGTFGWNSPERRADRYGFVHLSTTEDPDVFVQDRGGACTLDLRAAVGLQGTRGRLVVEVVEPRESTHMGDLFRGLRQRTLPAVGEHELAPLSGALAVDKSVPGWPAVGIRPDDGRAHDWLIPERLYALHDSVVRLYFVPEAADGLA